MSRYLNIIRSVLTTVGLSFFILVGCGGFGPYASNEAISDVEISNIDDGLKVETSDIEDISKDETNIDVEASEDASDDENAQDIAKEYLPGYATEAEFRARHTGSASLISDKTLIVSIFVDEEEDVWSQSEKDYMLGVCDIAYTFLDEYIESNYDVDVNLIYNWKENTDLIYSIRLFEEVPAYVTTEQEHHLDELEDEWVAQIPVHDLMLKYETTSIAFLYFIPHEGCSYSSMHFIEDDDTTWNEGCLLYLQDMYSPTYEYETPTVFAHELLHLFGAEDYYSSAEVFSTETYDKLSSVCADDIMLHTFDKINGVYTTYPDRVKGEITPVTAYLLGIYDETAVEDIPEFIREEKGVFPGSTYDRPF